VRLATELFAVAALIIFPSSACGQSSPLGAELFTQARFSEAEAWCSRVLDSADATDADLGQAYTVLSALSHIEGSQDRARRYASMAIALDPGALPPPGAPEALEELFEETRDAQPEEGLSVVLDFSVCAADEPPTISASAHGAPPDLVETTTIQCTQRGRTVGEGSAEGTTVDVVLRADDVEEDDAIECEASIRARSGAVLRAVHQRMEPCTGRVPSDTTENDVTEPTTGRARRSPWGWVGLGAGVLGVIVGVIIGTVFGTRSDEAVVNEIVLSDP
jgi:ElaB/YqjD/DUF883 family membrane-anchored ribosome-binding protein